MRLPILLSLFVVPVLACDLEEGPASSASGDTARERAADTRPTASADTNVEREKRSASSGNGTASKAGKPAADTQPAESVDIDEVMRRIAEQPPGSLDVLPFGAGMTRPERIQGEPPKYTPEALAARVEGTLIIKCVVEVTGKATRCRILKPLPHMERAVLDALKASRFKPATYRGHPISVDYTFTFEMKLPAKVR